MTKQPSPEHICDAAMMNQDGPVFQVLNQHSLKWHHPVAPMRISDSPVLLSYTFSSK
jgi:hypothetical protein